MLTITAMLTLDRETSSAILTNGTLKLLIIYQIEFRFV